MPEITEEIRRIVREELDRDNKIETQITIDLINGLGHFALFILLPFFVTWGIMMFLFG